MLRLLAFFGLLPALLLAEEEPVVPVSAETNAPPPHVVFVTGEEEYRSEESMPMLGKILMRDYGFKVTVCFSRNRAGYVDPNNVNGVFGLEALEDAELMVLFIRNRDLADEQMKFITSYIESGRPVVGFRTALHAFRFRASNRWAPWNGEKLAELFGQQWITHHGHVAGEPRTSVKLVEGDTASHPVLRGVEAFQCPSWLYHVHEEGPLGKVKLRGDPTVLLQGKSLLSNKPQNHPRTSPVAWVKTHGVAKGRVFYTSLGHADDFKLESVRRLALNGILWAMGLEDRIPETGAAVEVVGRYRPYPVGYGRKYRSPYRPIYFFDPNPL